MRKHEILIRKLFSDYNLLHLQAHSSLETVLWGFPKELYRWSVVTVTSYVGIHHTRVFSGKKLTELKKMPNWWNGPLRHCPELFACTLFLNTDVCSHFEEKAFWFPITREEIINPSISKVSRALFWLVVQSVNIAEVRHSTRVTHLCGSPKLLGTEYDLSAGDV